MSVTTDLDPDHKCLTIAIEGRFDFSAHKDFRAAMRQVS